MKNTYYTLLAFAACFSLIACEESDAPGSGSDDKDPVEEVYVDGTTVVNGRNAIDLGTDLLWADVNLGAELQEDFGRYYAWGETEPKETYTWANYKWADGAEAENGADVLLEKYCTNQWYGAPDGKTVLDAEDDAAAVLWGDGWRMPTQKEVADLLKNCEWEWNRSNGTWGYFVSSKKTKKEIFLPAAGGFLSVGKLNSGVVCNYWTSSLYVQGEQFYSFSYMYNHDGAYGTEEISWTNRYIGMTIRAVREKPVSEP